MGASAYQAICKRNRQLVSGKTVGPSGNEPMTYFTSTPIAFQVVGANSVITLATRCNALQRAATRCNALHRTATHCNALQRTATQCNALQHTTSRCNTLQ